jgi:hypothetical protein
MPAQNAKEHSIERCNMVSRSVFVVLAYYSSVYEQGHGGWPLYENPWLPAMAGMKHHQSSQKFSTC